MNLLTAAVEVQRCLGTALVRAPDAGKTLAAASAHDTTSAANSDVFATCISAEETKSINKGRALKSSRILEFFESTCAG